jgi:hypothetical protein
MFIMLSCSYTFKPEIVKASQLHLYLISLLVCAQVSRGPVPAHPWLPKRSPLRGVRRATLRCIASVFAGGALWHGGCGRGRVCRISTPCI